MPKLRRPSPAMVVAVGALVVATTGGAVAATAINGNNIIAGTIGTSKLANGAVTPAKIRAGAVGTPQLRAGSVGSVQIAPGGVTSSDLAKGSVGRAAIQSRAITGNQVLAGGFAGVPGTISGVGTQGNVLASRPDPLQQGVTPTGWFVLVQNASTSLAQISSYVVCATQS